MRMPRSHQTKQPTNQPTFFFYILFNPWMHGTYMTHISKTPIMNTLFKILIRIRCKKIENDLPKLLQQENLYKDGD